MSRHAENLLVYLMLTVLTLGGWFLIIAGLAYLWSLLK
jgi:hypothetical protein